MEEINVIKSHRYIKLHAGIYQEVVDSNSGGAN